MKEFFNYVSDLPLGHWQNDSAVLQNKKFKDDEHWIEGHLGLGIQYAAAERDHNLKHRFRNNKYYQ